jgi:hypothetical protein
VALVLRVSNQGQALTARLALERLQGAIDRAELIAEEILAADMIPRHQALRFAEVGAMLAVARSELVKVRENMSRRSLVALGGARGPRPGDCSSRSPTPPTPAA